MTTFATADAANVNATEPQVQALLRSWLERAGLPTDGSAWPLDTDDAAALLTAGEYSIDPGLLADLGERGQVPAVASWDARDICAAAACLEARRQWHLSPSVHDPKKTPYRLGLERQILAGDDGLERLRSALKQFDLTTALTLMVECENRNMREQLLATVQSLLILKGIESEIV